MTRAQKHRLRFPLILCSIMEAVSWCFTVVQRKESNRENHKPQRKFKYIGGFIREVVMTMCVAVGGASL